MKTIILNISTRENGELVHNEIETFNDRDNLSRFIRCYISKRESETKRTAIRHDDNSVSIGNTSFTFSLV